MNIIYILLFMIFCHIIADFHLQGILAELKQKSWWEKHYPEKMYSNDYQVALGIHSFSWSFMILLPTILFSTVDVLVFTIILLLNTAFHYIIDDLKANDHLINLRTDQVLHLIQIVVTWLTIMAISMRF